MTENESTTPVSTDRCSSCGGLVADASIAVDCAEHLRRGLQEREGLGGGERAPEAGGAVVRACRGQGRFVLSVAALEHASHRLYRIDDPAGFWRSLSPAQALALLKAAPKVLGPWRSEGHWWYRDGSPHAFVYPWLEPVEGKVDSFTRRFFSVVNRANYDTSDEAKAATDNTLRNNGFLLREE